MRPTSGKRHTGSSRRSARALCALAALLALGTLAQAQSPEPLPPEKIPHMLTLPERYPPTWVFAHDLNFSSLLDGKVAILDVAAETRPFKGLFDAGQMAGFIAAQKRPELYVTQTFLSRRTYGERTDVLTVFDRATLLPSAEIVLPPRRLQVVTQKNALQLTPDERFAFVMNFTPAASVSVVNLEARTLLGEVPTPGCNFVFPTGRRGFSSLCTDGTLLSFELDAAGAVKNSQRSEPFIDVENDPLYVKNARIGDITYFPSFRGQVQPVDFSRRKPRLLPAWSMLEGVPAEERWAPGGWQVIAGDRRGRLYVLMHADAQEGTHKYGGTEVWVFEAKSGRRLQRIELRRFSISIAATSSRPGYLVVTNDEMELDVYDSKSGAFERTLHVGFAANPFVVHTQ